MKKVFVAALTAIGLVAPASAAVITLEGITSVSNGFRFDYQGTLGPDEGVTTGSRLIIFDFAGFVAGSGFTPSANITFSTENTSNLMGFVDPTFTDDPTVTNLVFTYNGPDFRTTGGPFDPINFNGLGAVSTFRQTRNDGFTTFTIKNNPAATTGSTVFTSGLTQVPFVPEPATWAMMIAGFGLVGATMRRRTVRHVTA